MGVMKGEEQGIFDRNGSNIFGVGSPKLASAFYLILLSLMRVATSTNDILNDLPAQAGRLFRA